MPKRVRRPLSVLIKPASSRCNLRCTYCFYLEKQEIYPWKDHPALTIDTFRTFCEQYAAVSPMLAFNWQGGEPTLMGLGFFREAAALQREVANAASNGRSVPITNALQTNGTLLNEEWAQFLHDSDFLVGISVDGPAEWHDTYRYDTRGRATHSKVLSAIDLLRTHDVPFNILTVVSQSNVERPRELIHFLVDNDLYDLQFIPCMERLPTEHPHVGELTDYSITPEQYGRFLTEVFDEWVKIGYHKLRIRYFDNIIQMALGMPAEMCQLAVSCGYLVLEHNGDMYPCDFFVESEWKLGNVHEGTIADMVSGPMFHQFNNMKPEVNEECTRCQWRPLCHGECPRYRINGGGSHNELTYFCESYKTFFSSTWSRMARVADEVGRVRALEQGIPLPMAQPAPVATAVAEASPTQHHIGRGNIRSQPVMGHPRNGGMAKVGRNDPCPCGSGRKYKRCHGGS